MNHLSLFIGAGLAAAGPAFGQTLGAPPHALGTTAPPPVTVASLPRAAKGPGGRTGDNPLGRRATQVLNRLESQGYADFAVAGQYLPKTASGSGS
jgi:hypothetical protein